MMLLPWWLLLAGAPIQVPLVDELEVWAVVDNTYDCFQPDEKCAMRHGFERVDGFESTRLISEMGLAYLIRYTTGGKRHTILFDFALTQRALENNLEKLGLSLTDVEALVLSHGHQDHYSGLTWAASKTKAPLYVGNDDAFLERRAVTPKRSLSMGTLDRAALVEAGAKIIEVPSPRVVAGGALLSGTIPQLTPYEKVPGFLKMLKGQTLVQDPMSHELAIGFRVRGQGLVVVTSCAHAGVVNSIEALKAASGEQRVHAVLGGMHLTTAPPERVDKTVQALVDLKPDFVAPMHCTGDRAMRKLAVALEKAYVHPATGTKYIFAAPASGPN
jgi:7,8-dihydropterin-6-yl-methyl-4-(beta-D-ribofuranosyl)aminobenzene 5'-phosphate synthase